jgi:hypothetical protein
MASKKESKSAMTYVQRLFEDEYVQGQLRDAASGIRSAYGRISKKPERAAEDKKLYTNVRQAATSIRKAMLALKRPEPEPEPKHRFRALLIAIAVVAASVLIISKRGSERESADGSAAATADALAGDATSAPAAQPQTSSG